MTRPLIALTNPSSPIRPIGPICLIGLIALAATPPPARAADRLQLGDESALPADGPGNDIRGTPHVAFGQGVYLAVWREGWNGEGGTARIYAARLDKKGRTLDPKPIEVAPSKQGFQELPRVAFGGGVFLVVWQDLRNGKHYEVLGTRISPEGKRLDAQPIALGAGPRTQSVPDVAADGQNFLVAWQAVEGRNNVYHVRAARVDADGRVGDPVEIKSPWTKAGACPRIAWDGANYRVVFLSESMLGLRLARDGSLLDKDPVLTLRGNLGAGIGFWHAVAASPGKGVLVVFPRSQPDYWGWGGPGAMIGLLIGTDGKVDAGIPKESYPQSKLANWLDFGKDKSEGSPWPYGQCAAAWDGRHFVAVWQRHHIAKTVSLTNCDIIASRLDGWKPLDSAGVPVADSELEEKCPAIASDGDGNLLCLYEKHDKNGTVQIVARAIQDW
jgi:hypothetical protein